jgi:hypothetical protein
MNKPLDYRQLFDREFWSREGQGIIDRAVAKRTEVLQADRDNAIALLGAAALIVQQYAELLKDAYAASQDPLARDVLKHIGELLVQIDSALDPQNTSIAWPARQWLRCSNCAANGLERIAFDAITARRRCWNCGQLLTSEATKEDFEALKQGQALFDSPAVPFIAEHIAAVEAMLSAPALADLKRLRLSRFEPRKVFKRRSHHETV